MLLASNIKMVLLAAAGFAGPGRRFRVIAFELVQQPGAWPFRPRLARARPEAEAVQGDGGILAC